MPPVLLQRALPALTAVLALAVAATACGGDSDSPGRPSPASQAPGRGEVSVLTEEQAQAALLSGTDLGAGWVEQPNVVEADDEPVPGCIGTIDNLSELGDREVEVRRNHWFEDDFPRVSHGVSVWSDEQQVVEVFDRIEKAVEGCGDDEYDDQGVTYRISIVPSTDLPVEGVDDQFGYVATGTITEADGTDYPVHVHVNRFRVGRNVTSFSTTASKDETAIHDQFAQLAAERLVSTLEQP